MRGFIQRLVLTAALGAAVMACGDSDSNGGGARVTTPNPGGEATFGAIERLPGGTAVITSDHVLVSVTCDTGAFSLTTTQRAFAGRMDCAAMPPPDVIARYVDQPVAIVIADGRLKMENPGIGSLDFPVTEVRP
jgi:hypothetical protein